MKIAFFVTHLLGTGHLARAIVLARAFSAEGHIALIVSGGLPAPHLDAGGAHIEQLTPLRSDGVNFTTLLDAQGNTASDRVLAQRRIAAVAALKDLKPDIIVTELFPFGRRVLTEEFITILDAARQLKRPPLVCCSIRDILAPPSKPAKKEATDALIAEYYDAVLVHADAEIIPLQTSWPVSPAIASKLHYTGFVAPAPAGPHPDQTGAGRIVVSTGGGGVGDALFSTAIAAARLSPELQWHLLVGGDQAKDRAADMRRNAPRSVIVETLRPDFRAMLYHTTASVSMCGYNTALDILQSGAPAVFVPFDDGGETEQTLRACTLAHLNGIEVLSSDVLTPDALTRAIRNAIAAPRRAPLEKGMQGAAETVRILTQLQRARF